MRMMRRRSIVGAAVAVGAVSGARRNRAERKAIEGQQAQQNAPVEYAAAPQDDLTAQLEQLNDLKNKGILTQSEFDAKKKQLLGI
jgi:membrane protease subunit (stomatin/prohibitin family)